MQRIKIKANLFGKDTSIDVEFNHFDNVFFNNEKNERIFIFDNETFLHLINSFLDQIDEADFYKLNNLKQKIK